MLAEPCDKRTRAEEESGVLVVAEDEETSRRAILDYCEWPGSLAATERVGVGENRCVSQWTCHSATRVCEAVNVGLSK